MLSLWCLPEGGSWHFKVQFLHQKQGLLWAHREWQTPASTGPKPQSSVFLDHWWYFKNNSKPNHQAPYFWISVDILKITPNLKSLPSAQAHLPVGPLRCLVLSPLLCFHFGLPPCTETQPSVGAGVPVPQLKAHFLTHLRYLHLAANSGSPCSVVLQPEGFMLFM